MCLHQLHSQDIGKVNSKDSCGPKNEGGAVSAALGLRLEGSSNKGSDNPLWPVAGVATSTEQTVTGVSQWEESCVVGMVPLDIGRDNSAFSLSSRCLFPKPL